ncbi:hypothetical protein SAMN05216429_105230 [Marinobacter persicus]|uniref:Uncharacterized protein n=1 Tax=Marinobacter persicus TaxID=930118 RepID=A0A1I3TXZ3_9GAMM|nr:hypothetical protein [Marinobacter persicus]GHD45507.1 hypothetical protein GCM10008110_11330 [Marinobacter persicus]SFJ76104.1 hypothetical protein SAMN05216429_105230 [Marinobacter persicus]
MGLSEFLALMLGWLLGLLAPAIQQHISVKRKLPAVEQQVAVEMRELSRQLVIISFLCASRSLNLSKDMVVWCRDEFERLGDNGDNYFQELAAQIGETAELSSAQIDQRNTREAQKNFVGLSLKKYELPYTAANAQFILNFDSDTQTVIWEISNRINTLNQEIDLVRQYQMMTFDESISAQNHRIIIDQIKEKYRFISTYSRQLVERASLITSAGKGRS